MQRERQRLCSNASIPPATWRQPPLTGLHLGVVHPVGDFLLAEQVVDDLHPDGGLRVPPLQHHQRAAGLVHGGEPQAGGQCQPVSVPRGTGPPAALPPTRIEVTPPSLPPPGCGHTAPQSSFLEVALPGRIQNPIPNAQLNLEKALHLCTPRLVPTSPICSHPCPTEPPRAHHHGATTTPSQDHRGSRHGDLHGVGERRTGGQPVSPKGTRVAAAPVLDDVPAARAPQRAHGGLLQELGGRRRG